MAKKISSRAQEKGIDLIEASLEYLPHLRINARTKQNLEFITRAWEKLNDYLTEEGSTLPGLCELACRIAQRQHRGENLSESGNQQVNHLMALARTTVKLPAESIVQQAARFIEDLKASGHPDLQDSNNEDLLEQQKGITLGTIHAAKGLQWKTVFFMYASDQVIPGRSHPDDKEHLEEEQRIFYVASTRATDNLYYCSAVQSGRDNNASLTRFLDPVKNEMEYTEI